MADVSVDPTKVFIASGARDGTKLSIESMEAGDVLYLASNATQLGQANAANATDSIIAGKQGLFIALNRSVATGQPIAVAGVGTEVDFTDAIFQVAEFYAVSPTIPGGKMRPSREILTDEWHNIIGYAKTTSVLVIQPLITSLQRP